MTRVAFVIVGLLALSACSPGLSAAKRQAVVDFSCDSGDLETSRRSNDTYIVRGCGRTGVYQCPTGVGTDHRWCSNLTILASERFAAEFSCDASELSVAELSPYVFRVTGCGNDATYHCTSADGSPRCTVDAAR
jgi:hypothetical protein